MSDIMALHSEGASSLCVNGSVDMLGRLAGISASKYTGYPPYDDAPKEGEFDWDGFTRNLAIGLGVVAVCAIGAAISIATLGAGSILAGAFIGAGIGALSTTAMKAGEEISTGNVRSAKEAFRDVGISAASGFVTGAFGAKFPGAHRLVEGVVDTAVSAGERYLYAVFDDSMSREEKRAYAFDPGQMVADFVTGVVIGEILDGIMAAIQNKLRSIFVNYDATMREALESGRETELFLPDEYYQKLDYNIEKAIAARDAEVARIQGLSKTQQSNIATVVAGVDIRTGEVYVGVKNSRTYKGNATCAEDIVFRGLGGNTNANIIMTPAIRPRNNEVIPVCTRCQTKYPQNQFVKGTTFQ